MLRVKCLKAVKLSAAALIAAGLTLAVSATEGRAAMISGDLSLVGGVIPNTANISNATSLDFTPSGGGTGLFRAVSCDGDFTASLTCDAIVGDVGTIKDLQIDPFVPTVANFWTIGSFSFDLTQIVSIDRSAANVLTVQGNGIISAAGFTPTPGTWLFTANQSGATFSYSASSGAVAVPEPEALAMFGIGLLGLGGLISRRRRTAAH